MTNSCVTFELQGRRYNAPVYSPVQNHLMAVQGTFGVVRRKDYVAKERYYTVAHRQGIGILDRCLCCILRAWRSYACVSSSSCLKACFLVMVVGKISRRGRIMGGVFSSSGNSKPNNSGVAAPISANTAPAPEASVTPNAAPNVMPNAAPTPAPNTASTQMGGRKRRGSRKNRKSSRKNSRKNARKNRK